MDKQDWTQYNLNEIQNLRVVELKLKLRIVYLIIYFFLRRVQIKIL